MLDKHISPDDYEECLECGGMVNVYGGKLDGHKECEEEDCDFAQSWEYIG